MNLKNVARQYIAAVNQYDSAAIINMVEDDYIQHNPFVPTGRSAFIEFLSKLKAHGSRIENLRLFEDGPYIFMHHIWHNAAPFGCESALAFHIIRIKRDGRVAEHWNVMTPVIAMGPLADNNAKGTRISGNPDLTTSTRNQTVGLGKLLIGGNVSGSDLSEFFHEEFVDYSSRSEDSFGKLDRDLRGSRPKFRYLRQHKVLAEGEFALSISEGLKETDHVIRYDLYRYESGKIKERWSVSQSIPTSRLANDNTMFGFH